MAIAIFERWGLNPREQRLASFGAMALGVLLILAIPVGLWLSVSARGAENEELREALAAVNGARAKIEERKAKRAEIVQRYAQKAPPLSGFLGQNATANGLQVHEATDRPDVLHGKRYTERVTVVKFQKSGLAHIAKFLEALQKSGFPVSVTRLNLRKRAGEPDSFDAEVGVSAYDRNEPAPAPKEPGPTDEAAKESP